MKTIETDRVAADSPEFRGLINALDAELAHIDGEQHAFYDQYNGLEHIKHAVVVRVDGKAVACGAMKEFDHTAVEVKRMYTYPEFRGHRLAAVVLNELERWSEELGYIRCVLETGKRQPAAIRLFERAGYRKIERFGPYVDDDNSVCFEKRLTDLPI